MACKTAKHRGRDQTQIWVGEHDTRIARELDRLADDHDSAHDLLDEREAQARQETP